MQLSLNTSPARQGESGSVLLIVVAFLLLMSALILLNVGSFKTADTQDRIRITRAKQEFLIRELSTYVQRTNRLPCPASPATPPTTRGFGFSVPTCTLVSQVDGIVPFRELNLSQYDALDGWGRFMTYRISPVLSVTATNDRATPNFLPNASVGDNIFMRCRRGSWFNGSPTTGLFNIFPQKARFCCPSRDILNEATDLRVCSAAPCAAATTIDNIGRGKVLALPFYADIDAPATGAQGSLTAVPAPAGNEELFAVAIISHGQNGVRAYLGNGSAAQMAGNASADEVTNGNGGLSVIDRPITLAPGATYFDDIVIWRTQLTLMGELNNASCYTPWR